MMKNYAFFVSVLYAVSIAPVCSAADYLNKKVVLFPFKKAELSAQVESTITKIHFKTGESFKQGDVLAELDDELYQQMHVVSKAELQKSEEAYKHAKEIYENNKMLFGKNAIGEQELNGSHLDMVKALSEKERAKANLNVADKRLKSCLIRAPFSGRVINVMADEHSYMRQGQPVIEVADDNRLLASMNLPSGLVSKVKIGLKLDFKIDELNETCSGAVYAVAGSINPGSRTFEARAVIDNADGKLRVGMSGELVTALELGKPAE